MKTIGKEYTNKAERIAFLKDNCDKIDAIEEEKKATSKEFKLQLDPLQSRRKEMIGNIRSKAKLVTENCFQFTDREARVTEFYNDEGDCIEVRPATADELQVGLFTNLRPVITGKDVSATGTDGK